ncbi:hypothetical protein L9F63_015479 [Diploptera punctata]|uniref:15-hydroxyprostaglandin dehydrogenase [NAD(+)] n=1 Tax=Diploptera punctata TaxID=6984 RepID=A0AAD8A5I2_DIPPU|nr:hypothetical protein L9F63_015479 [Diploptera punctata]
MMVKKKSEDTSCKDPAPQKKQTLVADSSKVTTSAQASPTCQKELMSPKCKVAIITGGATGIGFSTACHLLKNCARHVIITGIDSGEGESAVEQLEERYGDNKVTFVCGDVKNPAHFEGLFEMACEAFGGTDILFNNAGILQDKSWGNEVDVNVKGVIIGTLLAFKYMGKDKGGKGGLVINNASIAGLHPLPGAPVYCITKHAVIGATLNFGHKFHYQTTGVRVCAICPGSTSTDVTENVCENQLTPEWGKEAERQIFLKPAQSPDVVGKAVMYILRQARSGTIWVVHNNILKFVEIPNRHKISTFVKEFTAC